MDYVLDLTKALEPHAQVAGAIGAVAAACCVSGYVARSARRKELHARGAAKRAARTAERMRLRLELGDALDWDAVRDAPAAALDGGAGPHLGRAVVQMSATQLLAAMGAGEVSAEAAVGCLAARALFVDETLQLHVNAEENFGGALAEAKVRDCCMYRGLCCRPLQLMFPAAATKLTNCARSFSRQLCDEERRAGKLRGPLHGLPMSLKDQVNQKGFDSSCGQLSRCGLPKAEHGLLASMLIEAGALPFVRTNVPQMLLLPETTNAIWGTSNNPHDPSRTVRIT